MKEKRTITKYSLVLAVAVGYFLPVLALTFYSNTLVGHTLAWNLFSVGISTGLLGSLLFLWMLSKWSSFPQETVTESAPLPPQEEIIPDNAIVHELEHFKEENATLMDKLSEIDTENQSLKAQTDHVRKEFEAFKSSAHHHHEQQQQIIVGLHETIAEQKSLIDKKQQQSGILETKVSDLTYEIKTLLKLAESHVSSISSTYTPSSPAEEPAPQTTETIHPQDFQIKTTEEASQQLKKCIDIAQKMTGSHRFGGQLHSLVDAPIDSFTLDLRRLCDTFRNENNSCVLLYSPRENQLIFANNHIKALTGWSPEKFSQAFFDIVQNTNEWQESLASLAMRSEAQINLSIKTKWGHEIAVHGQVSLIPTGIFRNHAIAVLYI